MLYVCSAASATRWRRVRLAAATPSNSARASASTAVQRFAVSDSCRSSSGLRPTACGTTSDVPTALMAACTKSASERTAPRNTARAASGRRSADFFQFASFGSNVMSAPISRSLFDFSESRDIANTVCPIALASCSF